MGYIAGLSDSTKITVKEYCLRNRITQVSWVENHLEADLKAEAEQVSSTKEEAAN